MDRDLRDIYRTALIGSLVSLAIQVAVGLALIGAGLWLAWALRFR